MEIPQVPEIPKSTSAGAFRFNSAKLYNECRELHKECQEWPGLPEYFIILHTGDPAQAGWKDDDNDAANAVILADWLERFLRVKYELWKISLPFSLWCPRVIDCLE